MIEGFKELTYEELLQKTNLMSLETRRLRADLIQVFRIFKGLDDIKPEELFIFHIQTWTYLEVINTRSINSTAN